MTDSISLTGIVATAPETRRIRDDVELTTFRLASSQRYFDRNAQAWAAGDTNWYTVSAFRHLAGNVRQSVRKGDRVLVIGRLRVRRWESGEKSGIAVEVDADTIGHDLAWGVSQYVRTPPKASALNSESESGPDPLMAPASDHRDTSLEPGRDPAASGLPPEGWTTAEPGHADGRENAAESVRAAGEHEEFREPTQHIPY